MNKRESPWHKLMQHGLEYFGRFYSVYTGFVVDTKDPENRNRLQVGVPAVDGTHINPLWAEPVGTWGGDDYGVQMLPSQGDLVWVSYRNGNGKFPTWQHGSFPKAGDDSTGKPDEFEHEMIYGFKTPRGNILLINDSEDGESESYIEIIHHENGKIRVEDAKILFETDEFRATVKDAILAATDSVELGSNATQSVVKGEILEAHINSILTNLATSGVYVGAAFFPLWNAATFTTLQSQTANIKSTKVKTE